MKVRDFIDQLGRRQIKDAIGTPRWSYQTWVYYINLVRTQLFQNHPEAFYVSSVITAYPGDINYTEVQADGSTIELDVTSDWVDYLLHRVCSLILGEDSDVAGNMTVANDHYQKSQLDEQ